MMVSEGCLFINIAGNIYTTYVAFKIIILYKNMKFCYKNMLRIAV